MKAVVLRIVLMIAVITAGAAGASAQCTGYGYFSINLYNTYGGQTYQQGSDVTHQWNTYYYYAYYYGFKFAIQWSTDAGSTWTTVASNLSYGTSTQTTKVKVPKSIPANSTVYARVVQEAHSWGCYYQASSYYGIGPSFKVTRGCNTPEVYADPKDQVLCVGEKLFLDVDVPLEPGYFTYEWYHDDNLISSSATDPDLTIGAVALTDAGKYKLKILDACGKNATTKEADVKVWGLPDITKQPVTTIICKGAAGKLTAEATGYKMSLQWYKDGVKIPGATTNQLLFSSAIPADAGTYHVEAVGACGTTVSNRIQVIVPPKPEIVEQPVGGGVCPGTPLMASVNATGTNLTYQWLHDGMPIPGANDATLTIPDASDAINGFYQCVIDIPGVKDATGCDAAVQTNQVYMYAFAAPSVVKQPEALDLCNGSSGKLTVVADGTGLSYQWYQNDMPVANATGFTLNLTSATAAQNGTYYAVVTGTCGLSTSTTPVNVGVYSQPTIVEQPTPVTVMMGEMLNLNFSATGVQEVTWMRNEKAIKTTTSTSLTIAVATMEDNGYYRAVVKNVCGGATSRLVKVTVVDPASLEPRLSTNMPSLEFGEVPYGYSGLREFAGVITNVGKVPVTIAGSSVTGADASAFSVVLGTAPTILEPGMSMDVTITFTPDHTGEEHATMLIESDATGGTQEVELVGSGVVRYTVDGSLSFGTVDKNSTTTKCFQINNTSATDIAIDQVQLSGANPTSFTISTPTPLAIAAGSTKELCLQFMPTDVGDYAATVSFKSMNGGNLDGATNGTCEIAASVTLDALEAGIVAFPNPSSESVTVTTGDVMPTDVRVVTTTGQYVTTLDPAKQLTWNLSDTNGAAVPSGTYVLVISDKHSTYRMMLQIVR